MAESDISLRDHGRSPAKNDAALTHARSLILRVCHIAGTAAFIDEAGLGPDGKDLRKAIRTRNTAALFDHLVAALSYQGISDEVAKNFMDRHGLASWHVIESALRRRPSCPKLRSYWHFYDCRYNKSRFTCAEPNHLADCPLPRSWLRNGRLNQTAYSLYLFVRDVANADLVGWIDRRLQVANEPSGPNRLRTHAGRVGRTVAGGLRGIRQSADDGAVAATPRRTSVPTALARSRRHHDRRRYARAQLSAPHRHPASVRCSCHSYGPACYRPGGCAEIIEIIAERDRCQSVRPPLPKDLSAVRAVRDLAVLLPAGPGHLQRQSDR